MDLIQELSQLTARAELTKRDVVIDQRARGFQTRARQLEPVADKFTRSAAQAATLRKARITVALPDKIAGLAQAALETVAAFDQDPTSAIEYPDELRYRFWDEAGDVLVRTDSALREAWREHVEASLPRIDRPIFDALPTVTAAHRQELASISESAVQLASVVPDNDDGLAMIRGLVGRMDRLIAAVDIDGLPGDVRAFVQAMSQQTATLDLITPEVATWLKAHGLMSRVFLRFGNQAR